MIVAWPAFIKLTKRYQVFRSIMNSFSSPSPAVNPPRFPQNQFISVPMTTQTYADIDIWVGWFLSADFLWGYLEYWLEGDPLPPAEYKTSDDEQLRPMCQFSLDHDCSYYNTEMRSYGYEEKPCSVSTLLQINGIPEELTVEVALKAESVLPKHRPLNAFVALWAESFDTPKTIQHQHYELHYLGSFRYFYQTAE
jgi:hypothetical protein